MCPSKVKCVISASVLGSLHGRENNNFISTEQNDLDLFLTANTQSTWLTSLSAVRLLFGLKCQTYSCVKSTSFTGVCWTLTWHWHVNIRGTSEHDGHLLHIAFSMYSIIDYNELFCLQSHRSRPVRYIKISSCMNIGRNIRCWIKKVLCLSDIHQTVGGD